MKQRILLHNNYSKLILWLLNLYYLQSSLYCNVNTLHVTDMSCIQSKITSDNNHTTRERLLVSYAVTTCLNIY